MSMGLCISLPWSIWIKIRSYKITSVGSNEMTTIRSLSFEGQKGEEATGHNFCDNGVDDACANVSMKNVDLKQLPAKCLSSTTCFEPMSEFDAAALKLQKVYKSYRTRRNLADCAVVAEQLWWKALDSASLERSSISFFEDEKPETAVSRWARAGTKAAKVGKGLSKSDKAQKLALRHWLEAIDPRHRYGHNLHLYYDVWFKSESTQPFFYWLDIGDGKEINLEKCPRNKLQQQCIQYLGPNEREHYEVIIENGRLVYKLSNTFVNTDEDSKWIFVLSTSRALYIGKKMKGQFQHSSFLAGGATIAAGRLVAKEGVLKAVWPYSGHYLPTEENFKEFIQFLEENNLDLSDVKRLSVEEGEGSPSTSEKKADEEPIAVDAKATDAAECPSNADGAELSGDEEDDPSCVPIQTGLELNDESTTELARKRSCKWTTGAGPRIGCVRDYPPDLQYLALEQVNLSPRVNPSPLNMTPIPSPRPNSGVGLSPALSYNMSFSSSTTSPTLPQQEER